MTLPLIFFILNGMVMANQSTAFPKLKFLCVFKRRCTGACNCPNTWNSWNTAETWRMWKLFGIMKLFQRTAIHI